MRIALIPVKTPSEAKMRLAGVLDAEARAGLALAMLDDVLAAAGDARRFDEIAVVSADSESLARAAALGARPIEEDHVPRGLNEGLEQAIRWLRERGAEELVVLPADIPLALPADIAAVVDALVVVEERRVALVRAGDGGTNALALRPPDVIPMRFGPQSADAHSREATAAGAEVIELDVPRMSFDVDGPEDLQRLLTEQPGSATRRWLQAGDRGLGVTGAPRER